MRASVETVNAIDPTREAKLKVGKKTYRLRFAVRELRHAERHLGLKALSPDGRGINRIISTFLDGSIENFLAALYIMIARDQPDITDDLVLDIADSDFDAARTAVYTVFGLTLPEPDPNVPPAAETTPEVPTSEPTATSIG